MNSAEAQAIAEQAGAAAARAVMHETWRLFGVDIDDQKQVNEFRADLIHARRWRKRADAAGKRVFLAVVVGGLGWLGVLIWDAVRPGGG